jgi:hypothetical protein
MPNAWMIATAALMLGLSPLAALPAQAQGMAEGVMPVNAPSQVPLVVIRYNQPKVFYQRQLYNAVARAVAIKPDVTFEVVSFVPQTGDSDRDEVLQSRATQQTTTLLRDMTGMGIPQERIRVSREAVNDATQHEIYIYVD